MLPLNVICVTSSIWRCSAALKQMQGLLTLSTFFTRTVKRACVELGLKALFRTLFASFWG